MDPKHPDGFRLAEDNNLYKNYISIPSCGVNHILSKL